MKVKGKVRFVKLYKNGSYSKADEHDIDAIARVLVNYADTEDVSIKDR